MGNLPKLAENHLSDLSQLVAKDGSSEVRHAALDTLAGINPARAAQIAIQLLTEAMPGDSLEPYLTPFLTRKQGAAALASGLQSAKLASDLRDRIRGALGATGTHSPALTKALKGAPEQKEQSLVGFPPYSQEWIDALASEVRKTGNATHGSKIYHRNSLACTTCHVIDGTGRDFGPELTAVGAGLPVEIIIESVIWPRRQIKEGYLSTTITTREGQIISGHLKHEDGQRIVIKDAVTRTTKTLAPDQVDQRQDAGTIMPPGLTSQLTRGELRDLIRFLSELRGK